jgi:hypothetical protein
MTGAEKRKKMDLALKEITIPFLKEQGFKGSFPHFRREKNNNVNLLTFQFSLYSQKFIVEISNCSINEFTNSLGKKLNPPEYRVHFMGNRFRLGSRKKTGCWYDFAIEPSLGNIYNKRAQEIISDWEEAEKWWEENPHIN